MELTREPVENLNKMVYYNKILKKNCLCRYYNKIDLTTMSSYCLVGISTSLKLFHVLKCNDLSNVNWIPAHGKVYLIQYYVIKFVSDLWQVECFLRVLLFLH